MSRFHVITLCMIILCAGNCIAEPVQDTCDTGIQDTIIVGSVHVPGPLWPDSIGVPIYIWADESIAAFSWGLRPLDNRIRISSFSSAGSVLPNQMFIPTLIDSANNRIGFGWADFTGANPADSPQGLIGIVYCKFMPNISIGEELSVDSTSILPVYVCKMTSSLGSGSTCVLRYIEFVSGRSANFAFGTADSSLDLYYSFDEPSGTILYDRSPNRRDGSLHNDCQRLNGVFGRGLKFDGIDDYVTFPDLYEFGYWGPLSVSLWFKPLSNSVGAQDIVFHGSPGYWEVAIIDGDIWTGLYFANEVWAGNRIPLAVNNDWHNVSFTWIRAGALVTYIDGDSITQDETPNFYLHPIWDAGRTIGCVDRSGPHNFFAGEIDEFKVWKRSLSAQEILAEYLRVGYVACGDADASRQINITDAVFIINYIFGGGAEPSKPSSADVSCDGRLDITDAVYLINYFFANGAVPCAGCPQM